MKKCIHCKERVSDNSQFCPHCGMEFTSDKPNKKNISNAKKINAKKYRSFLLSVGVLTFIIAGLCALVAMQNTQGNYQGNLRTSSRSNSPISEKVPTLSPESDLFQVASYFECSCGDCEDHELSTCQCPTAKSQRDFIQKHLDEGKNIDEVRMLVNEVFGSLKPQYKNWVQSHMKKALQSLHNNHQQEFN